MLTDPNIKGGLSKSACDSKKLGGFIGARLPVDGLC